MAISFHCPNGHKLNAPEEQVGRAVKCPTCEAAFRVPAWSDQVEPADENGLERATATAKPVHREKPATIVFLCPNGHRLNSPASLAGRPGQCPHCGIKFLVPGQQAASSDESQAKNVPDTRLPEPALTGESGPAFTEPAESAESRVPSQDVVVDVEMVNSNVVEDELPMIDMEEVVEAVGGNWSGGDPTPSEAASGQLHPMSELMTALWSHRTTGTTIEVRLSDGEIIVPDGYAQELSRRSHCLLMVRAPDGTHTLTAVAWDAIARVSIRGVKSLRPGMFAE